MKRRIMAAVLELGALAGFGWGLWESLGAVPTAVYGSAVVFILGVMLEGRR